MDATILAAGGTAIAAVFGAIGTGVGRWLTGRSAERREALQQALTQQSELHGRVQALGDQLGNLQRAQADERVNCAKQIATLEADGRRCAERDQHREAELRIVRKDFDDLKQASELERARHAHETDLLHAAIGTLARELERLPGTPDDLMKQIRRSLTPSAPMAAVKERKDG